MAGPALVYRRPCIPGATPALRSVKLLPCWKRRCPFDPTSGSATCSRRVAAGSPSEVAMPHTPTRAVGRARVALQSSVGGIRVGIAILRHNQSVGRLNAKRLMTSYAPQLRGPASQRHPISATRADGIWRERCPCDDSPLAGAGVRDFEAVVWQDYGAVAHHDDRFLGTGAEHGVPRATAQRAFYIDHQAGPPFCGRRCPALPCTHGTPRPNLRELHVLHTPYYGLVLRFASKVTLGRSVVERTLVQYSVGIGVELTTAGRCARGSGPVFVGVDDRTKAWPGR